MGNDTLQNLWPGSCHGDRGKISVRAAIAFDTTPESWMAQQTQYDVWTARTTRKALEKKVKRLAA
jgi:plasmid maintenance system antidote protein VapI